MGFRLTAALTSELKLPHPRKRCERRGSGEMWQGAGHGRRTIVCVTLEQAWRGIILDGNCGVESTTRPPRSTHVSIPSAASPVFCGSRGCLEVYASATAIVRMAREPDLVSGLFA